MTNRILVVDDAPRILNAVSRFLSAEGYAVEVACDGARALAKALEGSYKVIILDVQLPELDGFECLRRIREQRPDQAVIVVSCLSDAGTRQNCRSLRADYLSKPFTFSELISRVRSGGASEPLLEREPAN